MPHTADAQMKYEVADTQFTKRHRKILALQTAPQGIAAT